MKEDMASNKIHSESSLAIIQNTNSELQLSDEFKKLLEGAADLAQKGVPENTRRALKSDWKHFTAWCDEGEVPALPTSPMIVCAYIRHLFNYGKKHSTIKRHVASIAKMHRIESDKTPEQPIPDPTKSELIKVMLRGIKREINEKKDDETLEEREVRIKRRTKQKKALTIEHVRVLIPSIPDDVRGLRDKALILLGFAGAFRRSELVDINVEDLEFQEEGLLIRLPFTKTGEDAIRGVTWGQFENTCPIRALKAWLELAEIAEGPVFLQVRKGGNIANQRLRPRAAANVLKQRVAPLGWEVSEFSGHSLRRGWLTTAAKAGLSLKEMMSHAGQKTPSVTLGYIELVEILRNSPSGKVGL